MIFLHFPLIASHNGMVNIYPFPLFFYKDPYILGLRGRGGVGHRGRLRREGGEGTGRGGIRMEGKAKRREGISCFSDPKRMQIDLQTPEL